jgi:hypothetical protein
MRGLLQLLSEKVVDTNYAYSDDQPINPLDY